LIAASSKKSFLCPVVSAFFIAVLSLLSPLASLLRVLLPLLLLRHGRQFSSVSGFYSNHSLNGDSCRQLLPLHHGTVAAAFIVCCVMLLAFNHPRFLVCAPLLCCD